MSPEAEKIYLHELALERVRLSEHAKDLQRAKNETIEEIVQVLQLALEADEIPNAHLLGEVGDVCRVHQCLGNALLQGDINMTAARVVDMPALLGYAPSRWPSQHGFGEGCVT